MRDASDGRSRRTRRSFVKQGALVSGGLALGATGNGIAVQDPGGNALMFNDEFRPGARFRVVSPPLDQRPDVVEDQDVWQDTETRAIQYQNTGERVLFFPVARASVEQGRVYQFTTHDLSVFQDDEGIVSVGFELPSGEADSTDPTDGSGSDYEVIDGGGAALIAVNNFYPGALFRVVSDVVAWTPREDVQGSDVFAEYNTRFGEYHNSSDEFLFYPAHAASVERGALYVMRDEFDATEPEGRLVTTHFDRVDESTVETPIGDGTRSNATRRSATATRRSATVTSTPDAAPGTTAAATETGGQPGFGPLLAGLGIGGGLLARGLARWRELNDD